MPIRVIRQLLNESDNDWLVQRQQYVHCQDCIGLNKNQKLQEIVQYQKHTSYAFQGSVEEKETDQHEDNQEKEKTNVSQSQQQTQTQQQQQSYKLSKRGEDCAVQFFRNDYELLKVLLESNACKFDKCHLVKKMLNIYLS